MTDESLKFPKKADKPRLQSYDQYDKIYAGEHFDSFSIRGEKDFTEAYNRLRYIVANFGGLMSRVMADMLFGEKVTVDVEKNQEFIDSLMEENELISQLYESSLVNSRRGDDVFKLRIGPRNVNNLGEPSSIIIERVGADMYFPEFDGRNARNTPAKDVLIWQFTQLNAVTQKVETFLHKESHRPGYIEHEIYKYDPREEKIISQENVQDFGFKELEETKIKKSLIVHIPNVRDGRGFFGTSDYQDLIPLFFALNNRITKIDNILDKHSDPILAVPPGVIDENGQIRKESLGMFEVDSENPGFNKPEYIVWNANLESAMKEIDQLVQFLFMFSEIAPATMGADKDGVIESGRALKFKLLATIRKRNRKKSFYDAAMKKILEIAQELAIAHRVSVKGFAITQVERPKIDWGDGIINDETEMTTNAISRVDAGLLSKADAIARLDGITPEEAKDKVKEIEAEATSNLPLADKGGPFQDDKPVPNAVPKPNQPVPQGS